MMKSRALLFLVLVMGLALGACVKSREQPVVGGETNWLKRCTDQDGCGAGSCICGVCTTECNAAATCSGDFAGSCIQTTSPLGASACAGAQQMPVGLCLPGCGSDAECGSGFACRDAVCVTEATAQRFQTQPQPPGESDAGGCRAVERCDLGEMCNFASARPLALECYRPFAGPYAARCGGYDSIVSSGTDSTITYYYGQDGALVGTSSSGLSNEPGCVSYDAAFSLPGACTAPPLCPFDAGMTDAGTLDGGEQDAGMSDAGQQDAGMADAGQDAAAMLCDCSSEEVSLACVCAQTTCVTFKQAVADVFCQVGFPGRPRVERGCGYKQVTLGAGLGARTFVYEGIDETLVGASTINDVPFGTCSQFAYRAQIPDLRTCADYSICDLCPGQSPCEF